MLISRRTLYLKNYSCIPIYRNYKWINNHLVTFLEFWNKIEYYKKNERYKQLISSTPSVKKYKPKYEFDKCMIDSDSD